MNETQALLLSAAIEAPIAFLVSRLTRWPSRGNLHVAAAAAAATAISHPQFWQAMQWSYERFAYWPSVMVGETCVMLFEAALIAWMAGLRIERALAVSVVANASSFLFGLAVV